MSMLVRIAGKPALVSDFAGQVIKRLSLGMPQTKNGFGQRVSKIYPDPGAVLIESSKTLKNGKTVKQSLWSWPDGATAALTQKSDGFLSYVAKNAEGKVTKSLISKNNSHLVERSTTPRVIDGQCKNLPYENYVNGSNIARFLDGKLWAANNSASQAQYLVQETRKETINSFRCIG